MIPTTLSSFFCRTSVTMVTSCRKTSQSVWPAGASKAYAVSTGCRLALETP